MTTLAVWVTVIFSHSSSPPPPFVPFTETKWEVVHYCCSYLVYNLNLHYGCVALTLIVVHVSPVIVTPIFVAPKSPSRPLTLLFIRPVSRPIPLICRVLFGLFVHHHSPQTSISLSLFFIKRNHYIFTFNSAMKNCNPPHDKQEWQFHSVDMKIGMQYNEFYELK